jgi:hypothetical protein
MSRRLRSLRIVALIVVVSLPLFGMSGLASAKAKGCHKTHTCKSGGGGSTGGGTGGAPAPITVQIDPDLVETYTGGIAATIQVETSPSLAGDAVLISSSQLQASCAKADYYTLQGTTAANVLSTFKANDIQVILDDDGNATVIFGGLNCAPGSDIVEASLEVAPFYTGLGTLQANAPVVTPAGVFGYPTTSGSVTTGEVETGNTATSGDSDVYAVFYVETDPVYAEQTVEISSAQLEASCITGWTWTQFTLNGTTVTGTGVNTGPLATATLDDDGNAIFAFFGTSCAATTSDVIADVLAGTHPTYPTTFTVDAPQPTI